MSSKGQLFRLLSRFVLNEAEVLQVSAPAPSFRLVRLRSDPTLAARFQPGDKVQVLLPDTEVRTYTPIHWDEDGTTSWLIFVREETSSARWGRSVAIGDRVRFHGPARSLVMPEGPIALVGDETSIAVAASYARARLDRVRVFLEVDAGTTPPEVLDAVGLRHAQVVVRDPNAPRGDTLAGVLPEFEEPVGLTGGAELVVRTRIRLQGGGAQRMKTKVYWVQGKQGLD